MSQQHSFTSKFKTLHWWYCTRCGLILLNNKATAKAAKGPCHTDWAKPAPDWVRNA